MPVDLASPPRPPAPGSRFPVPVRRWAKRDDVGASLPARLGGGADGWIALGGPEQGGRGGGGCGRGPLPEVSGEVPAAALGLRGGGEPQDPGGVPRPLGRSGRGIRRLVPER